MEIIFPKRMISEIESVCSVCKKAVHVGDPIIVQPSLSHAVSLIRHAKCHNDRIRTARNAAVRRQK